MTPSQLAHALDLIAHAIEGAATPGQKAQAREDLTSIRGLLRDVRNGPSDAALGRQVSVIKPSVTLMKLQCLAPPLALDGVVRWVEAQEGTRGLRELTPISLVTEDGTWTKLVMPAKSQDAGFHVFKRELTSPTP